MIIYIPIYTKPKLFRIIAVHPIIIAETMATLLVLENSMIESSPLVKLLVAEYFKVKQPEDIEIRIKHKNKADGKKTTQCLSIFFKIEKRPRNKT